ncbi:MAG: NYN domain-containing protein, partial [Atopobiaceae bacterium]
VTSDATVQATVYGPGVTRVSSRMLAGEVDQIVSDNAAAVAERTHGRMTVEDRLDPETLRRLNGLIGR